MITTDSDYCIGTRYNSIKDMVVVKKYRDMYKITYHKNLRISGRMDEGRLKDLILNNSKNDKRERIQVATEYGDREYLYERNVGYKNINVYVDDLTGIEYYTYDVCKYGSEIENPEKLANSISRSRATIYELALCNDWDYFCTFTLDKEKYDRYDLKKFHKDFTQKIRDLNKKYKAKIDFILIPEKHKDGAWHMHGFMKGIPEEELRKFTNQEHLPLYILDKVIQGKDIYSWKTYEKKFGFCDLEPIENIYKASAYVTKYVTKSLSESIKELNAQTYYCSRGLKRAEQIQKGFIENAEDEPMEFDFENDYVKIKWVDAEEYNIIKDFIDKE